MPKWAIYYWAKHRGPLWALLADLLRKKGPIIIRNIQGLDSISLVILFIYFQEIRFKFRLKYYTKQ